MQPQSPAPYPYGYLPPPPKRSRAPWIFLAVLVVTAAVAVVVIAAVGGFTSTKTPSPAASKTFAVYGTVKLNCTTNCLGYMDINNGAQVEVVDGSNQVLAVGYLTPSTDAWSGTYTFTVQGVPRGRNLYGVHVGNVNRGVVWESEAQAASGGFALSIG